VDPTIIIAIYIESILRLTCNVTASYSFLCFVYSSYVFTETKLLLFATILHLLRYCRLPSYSGFVTVTVAHLAHCNPTLTTRSSVGKRSIVGIVR
jgi:hypothetical protein